MCQSKLWTCSTFDRGVQGNLRSLGDRSLFYISCTYPSHLAHLFVYSYQYPQLHGIHVPIEHINVIMCECRCRLGELVHTFPSNTRSHLLQHLGAIAKYLYLALFAMSSTITQQTHFHISYTERKVTRMTRLLVPKWEVWLIRFFNQLEANTGPGQ